MRYLFSLLIVALATVSPALAGGAHCYCKLGPISAPIHNFGEIEHWSTQVGHDGACKDSCNTKADAFMRDSGNRTAACNASHNASIVAYSAVGTKSYQAGGTYNCPQSNPTPAPGGIYFPGSTLAPTVKVNSEEFSIYSPPTLGVRVPASGFTTFELHQKLDPHVQKWTFDAYLYCAGGLLEQLTAKSPAAYAGGVVATFTQQPNSVIRGKVCKIAWHYAGKGLADGSVSFQVRP